MTRQKPYYRTLRWLSIAWLAYALVDTVRGDVPHTIVSLLWALVTLLAAGMARRDP